MSRRRSPLDRGQGFIITTALRLGEVLTHKQSRLANGTLGSAVLPTSRRGLTFPWEGTMRCGGR